MPFIEFQGKRILFIHIPRTGGTSVEHWLRSQGKLYLFTQGVPMGLKVTPQHLTANDLKSLFGLDYFDYCFAIVRNPFQRIASEYRLRHRVAQDQMFRGFPSFPLWLENSLLQLRQTQWHLDNHLRPQWEFLADRVKIFRFEDGIAAAMRQVAADTGLAAPEAAPHELSTAESGAELAWDLAEVTRVRELYREDLRRFGYGEAPPGG